MDCHFLLQGIFLTQGSNPGLPHCRQTLYRLSHQGSLKKREPHPSMCVLSIAAFMLQRQSWVVVTQITRSAEPQIFTTWLFTEKICWFLAMDKELSWIKMQKSIRRISKSTKKHIKKVKVKSTGNLSQKCNVSLQKKKKISQCNKTYQWIKVKNNIVFLIMAERKHLTKFNIQSW